MVINFCFIVIYQLNIDMRPTSYENIDFSSLYIYIYIYITNSPTTLGYCPTMSLKQTQL